MLMIDEGTKGGNDVYVLKVQRLIDGFIDRLGAQRPSSRAAAAAAGRHDHAWAAQREQPAAVGR